MVWKVIYFETPRGKEQIRVLYTVRGKDIILLHVFKKKARRTPLKEIRTALLRLDKI